MFPIAWTLHVEDLGVIDESVDDGVSDGIVGKDLIKLSEGDIGRGDSAKRGIVSCGKDLEKQIRCLIVQGHVTEFVNDEHLRSSVTIKFIFNRESFLSGEQPIYHFGGCDEES